MVSKQLIFILILIMVYFVVIGAWIGSFLDTNLHAAEYWVPLIFACFASYNVGAFFFGWTIIGGPGVVISADRDKFDRVGGALVSGVAALGLMVFWVIKLG